MDGIYLDYNGSAPLDPRVAAVMSQALTEGLGNASAVHRFGRRQTAAVDEARDHIAAMVGGRPSGVIFTSGATEANNLVLRGAAEGRPPDRQRLLISAVEHASVSQTAAWLKESGQVAVDIIPVTPGGFVDPDQVGKMVGSDVLLVSVMAANSETGVLNPAGEIAERVHSAGALFHCDATQFAGRLPFDLEEIGADFVSVSSHKICGPTGAGALIGTRFSLRRLRPILHGGGHERGLRSGSLNVAGIVGFGAAARIATEERTAEQKQVAKLRDQLTGTLKRRLPGVHEIGDTDRRLPNTACLRFEAADGPGGRHSHGSGRGVIGERLPFGLHRAVSDHAGHGNVAGRCVRGRPIQSGGASRRSRRSSWPLRRPSLPWSSCGTGLGSWRSAASRGGRSDVRPP